MDAARRDCLLPKIETPSLPFPPFGGAIIGYAGDVSTRPPPVNFWLMPFADWRHRFHVVVPAEKRIARQNAPLLGCCKDTIRRWRNV